MTGVKNVLAIVGSASKGSFNQKLVENVAALAVGKIKITEFDLFSLPHFNPSESINNPPAVVIDFREQVEETDGVLICTPEYVFSIPAILKNAIEWCVATTVFSDKPVGMITASSSGVKGHEQLQMIMKTLNAIFSRETTLLLSGFKSKMNTSGEIVDPLTKQAISSFAESFINML
jgi:chromate reductase, NAD(P)H dehydrogenase (quinone)